FASAQPAPVSCSAPFNVGLRIITVPNGPKMAVWYPSTVAGSSYAYSTDLSGSVAVNGAVQSCAHFPLVVFSHGFGGCGTQSDFFTEELARHGYIVAAPDHHDALCSVDGSATIGGISLGPSFLQPNTWTDASYDGRKADVEAVVNWMLASADFASSLD